MSLPPTSGMEWLEGRERALEDIRDKARAGDGMKVNLRLDTEASQAERARPRVVRRRLVVDGSRTYTAFDAHSLLEDSNATDRARPGHLY